ncbi:MAG TPA: bifunctional DNA-formamidopyrimidine glycosylase/DNA-(apurinic or apyrimidinic site) lyase [Phycisphaerales bacterium]|nr:bifunctional DNA-formamidopyrimidine glycosylase/DNA-(apurinic or apyrimidinic site) lyase [Phycisphaerales bacterium]
MPELPEVETVRRTLTPHLVGRVIDTARLRRCDFVTGKATPAALLQGATIDRLERRGKQLAVIARDGRAVIVQLGMSGQVLVARAGAALPTHVHAVWTLKGAQTAILFRDPRRFGGLTTLGSADELARVWESLGPDALTTNGGELWNAIRTSARAIKPALLDQRTVAGVGNIYADEALFESGVHPKAICRRLSRPRVERLARAIREVLARAVEARGSSLRDYRDADGQEGAYAALHRVYGRGGLPCHSCGRPLQKLTVGQRTTVCCPRCQSR